MTASVTHHRATGGFGFGVTALCGAGGSGLKATTRPKYVTCPACRGKDQAIKAAARERLFGTAGPPSPKGISPAEGARVSAGSTARSATAPGIAGRVGSQRHRG